MKHVTKTINTRMETMSNTPNTGETGDKNQETVTEKDTAHLPNWEEIKKTHPDLSLKLQKNRYDYHSIKEYLKITLGGVEITDENENKERF